MSDKLQTKFSLDCDYKVFKAAREDHQDTIVELVLERPDLAFSVRQTMEWLDLAMAENIPADMRWYARQQVSEQLNQWNQDHTDEGKSIAKDVILDIVPHDMVL